MTSTHAHTSEPHAARLHEHLVLLYQSEEVLARSVVTFLAPALIRDEPMLVVATGRHRRLFADALETAGADLPGLRKSGLFAELDAEDTLAAFLHDGLVSREGFDTSVGQWVRALSAAHGRVHIYGEMVSCLWGRGDAPAAVELERLWNDLARHQDFRLCCAYPANQLASDEPAVDDMLAAHSAAAWLD
jgi:hypothetical protein